MEDMLEQLQCCACKAANALITRVAQSIVAWGAKHEPRTSRTRSGDGKTRRSQEILHSLEAIEFRWCSWHALWLDPSHF